MYNISDYSWHTDIYLNDSYNEHWSEEYDYETDYEDYFDLRENLKAKICERNEEPEMNKVCCTEDDIQVGFLFFSFLANRKDFLLQVKWSATMNLIL